MVCGYWRVQTSSTWCRWCLREWACIEIKGHCCRAIQKVWDSRRRSLNLSINDEVKWGPAPMNRFTNISTLVIIKDHLSRGFNSAIVCEYYRKKELGTNIKLASCSDDSMKSQKLIKISKGMNNSKHKELSPMTQGINREMWELSKDEGKGYLCGGSRVCGLHWTWFVVVHWRVIKPGSFKNHGV